MEAGSIPLNPRAGDAVVVSKERQPSSLTLYRVVGDRSTEPRCTPSCFGLAISNGVRDRAALCAAAG
eukprot:6001333-Amphidinium_carterae.2